jgi:hypothetical protein
MDLVLSKEKTKLLMNNGFKPQFVINNKEKLYQFEETKEIKKFLIKKYGKK